MNVKAKPSKLDWKKVCLIALVLAVAGFEWYRQNYPADQPVAVETSQPETYSDKDYQVNFPADNASDKSAGNRSSEKRSTKPLKPAGPFLKPAGGKNLKSPAGLIYGMGGGGEHRTDHVLRHSKDDTSRPSHGVFNAQGDEVFILVDEAFELIKSKSRQVKSEKSDGKMAHVVDMKRKIGFKGGQSGKRANNPALYKIKLILVDTNRVITAYPY